jgi:MtN3 and saliva related transmembrane protein
VHLGEISGWTSVALGQLVSWPQVLKLRHERGDGVSLASYAIVLVSMSLFLVHAVTIGDSITMVSVPLSLCPNVLIAVTLARRRRKGAAPKAVAIGAGNGSEGEEVMATP